MSGMSFFSNFIFFTFSIKRLSAKKNRQSKMMPQELIRSLKAKLQRVKPVSPTQMFSLESLILIQAQI